MAILAGILLALPFSVDGPQLTDESADAPQLKHAFNKAKGSVRMVLIVSPG
jgi:hypothetical protein